MSLYSARADLADALQTSTGFTTHEDVPDRLEPPCLAIEASDNYVSPGSTFDPDDIAVRLDVIALVPIGGDSTQSRRDLDGLLKQVLKHLPEDWTFIGSGKPGPLTNGEWLAYGVPLTVESTTSNEGA